MESLIMALSGAFVLNTKPWLLKLVQIIIKHCPIIIFKRRTPSRQGRLKWINRCVHPEPRRDSDQDHQVASKCPKLSRCQMSWSSTNQPPMSTRLYASRDCSFYICLVLQLHRRNYWVRRIPRNIQMCWSCCLPLLSRVQLVLQHLAILTCHTIVVSGTLTTLEGKDGWVLLHPTTVGLPPPQHPHKGAPSAAQRGRNRLQHRTTPRLINVVTTSHNTPWLSEHLG